MSEDEEEKGDAPLFYVFALFFIINYLNLLRR